MKISKLIVLGLLALPFITNAQSPANSSGSSYNFIDFSLTDTDGNNLTLSTYLTAGKTVILDFMQPECGPCWEYKETHALRDLYIAHGPSGTNTMMVIQVNTFDNMGVSELSGNNSGNWNWLSGPYPTVSVTAATKQAIVGGYNAWGTPKLIEICPNGNAWDVESPFIAENFTDPSLTASTAAFVAFRDFCVPPSTSSISTNTEITFDIYPNPTTGNFIVESITGVDTIKVTDLTGKIIFNYTGGESKVIINLNDYSNGSYIVEVTTESKTYNKKLIKI